MAEFNVYFNGEKLPIRVLGSFTRGPMIGEYENKTTDIADMDGTEVISSRIKEGIIEVPFVIQGDLHTAHDEMMRILNVDGPKKLQFSDQMDRYYLAIPQGKSDADELAKWFERGSISFLVPSGVAYAEEETIVTNEREVVTETFVVDGSQAAGSIFVKDLPGPENELITHKVLKVPTHRNQPSPSINWLSISNSDQKTRFITTGTADPYYRPVASGNGLVLKRSTKYTMTFEYNIMSSVFLRIRWVIGITRPAVYFDGNGSAVVTFTTGNEGAQYISFDPVREKTGGGINSAQIGDWFEIWNLQMVEGEYTELPYRPAPEDVGIVHGQPNFLDGTSRELKQTTITAYLYVWKAFTIGEEFKVGDKVAAVAYLKVPATAVDAKLRIRATVNGTIQEHFGNRIPPNTEGYSKIEYEIPSGCTQFMFLIMSGTGDSIVIETKDEKLIKGSLTAMDEWTPSQQDSGLTIINNGMVPFEQDQYAALADPLKYVRAETTQVGRGAEIQFDFKVIEELEKRYPYLFTGMNLAEKIDLYRRNLKNVKGTFAGRGMGVNPSNGRNEYYATLSVVARNNDHWGVTPPNRSGNIETKELVMNMTHMQQLQDNGSFILIARTKYPNLTEGVISDGITQAWVEVKDIKLEIEIELPRKQALTINNDGSHKAAPDFTFEFEEDNGYIGVVHQDGIIQYGSPGEVDGVTKQKSVVLLQDRFDNNKGWEINSSKAVTMLPMTANGTVKWDPNQSFVYPTSFGTGSGWHGVTLTQALSQEADNFTLESLSRMQDIWAEKAGRLEFTISAADGTILFSMQFRDDSVSSSQNQFWAYVGNNEVDRDTSTWRWRWWLGSLTVRKAGNLWEWTIQNGQNKMTRQYLDGGYAVSNKKAARITIAFAAYGDKKPIAWEDIGKNKSGMGWSELRFVKDNVDYWVDLPNKMKAGDTVEIRNTEGKIYKYWQNQEPIKDMLDADIGNEYFLLPVGESDVQFHFSDYMSELPLITAKYRKTYR